MERYLLKAKNIFALKENPWSALKFSSSIFGIVLLAGIIIGPMAGYLSTSTNTPILNYIFLAPLYAGLFISVIILFFTLLNLRNGTFEEKGKAVCGFILMVFAILLLYWLGINA